MSDIPEISINITMSLSNNSLALSDGDNTIYLNRAEQNLIRSWLYHVDFTIRKEIETQEEDK